jgi:two-component system sensor histidine kinase HydH
MSDDKKWRRVMVIALMIGIIVSLHYFTLPYMGYRHAFYRMLFYLPLVLGSFWFGMKGAMYVCASVSVLYLPYAMMQWKEFSLEDFHEVLEGVLYVIIAFIVGSLVEKERQKHRALVQAERLAAIGKAVSEVAHDMKTPLTIIGGFATLVSKKLSSEDPNQKRLGLVMQETERLDSMVKQMLDFGHPLELQTTKTSLNELLIETTEIAEPLSKNSAVDLRVDLEPSLPRLPLDGPRIKQVLLNLITNAVEASPAGECVLIRTVLESHAVALEVVDHGLGITEEHRHRVFDPFFSTKKGGTGLGLGIVKKIVEAHGGDVSFQSNPEKGATFRVHFPF